MLVAPVSLVVVAMRSAARMAGAMSVGDVGSPGVGVVLGVLVARLGRLFHGSVDVASGSRFGFSASAVRNHDHLASGGHGRGRHLRSRSPTIGV
jgi:hypothetical protein